MKNTKKLLTLIILIIFIFAQSILPAAAIVPPAAPTAPSSEAVTPDAPQPPPPPTLDASQPEPQPSSVPQSPTNQESSPTTETLSNESLPQQSPDNPNTTVATDQYSSSDGNESNAGDTFIQTGDAVNDSDILTLGNSNLNNNLSDTTIDGESIKVVNAENGSGSENQASVNTLNNSDTNQDNHASVGNNLSQNSTTGKNDASRNVGDSIIKTGDANTTGTIVTGVNTNFDGISVSEFQIADVHTGDLVLDFAANCIINCGNGDLLVKNIGNGSDSINDASVNNISNDTAFQNNDASVESNLILASNSGQNSASQNTNGDSFIQTGDANISANVLTFANNNFSGNVLFGVVDIFGTLDGDIILTDQAIAQALGANCNTCSGNNINVSNTTNGSNSDNNALVNLETNNTTLQTNDADIQNNLNLEATTGENTASQNTGGDTFVQTGNSEINAQTVNIANSNVDGGNWWLVIVNKAGEWVGQLLGAPVGSMLAGSQGSEFNISDTGEITATNTGNGSNSENNATINQESNNTTSQTNNANIINNLNLSANTGGNDASKNTGGSNTIKTGDAKIVANLVNFVNNNIVGGQKLIVTVVNVFGSWFGDFVTPGHQKNNNSNQEESVKDLASNTLNVGGPSNSENSSPQPSQNNNNNNSGNDNNSSNETTNNVTTSVHISSNPSNSSNPSAPSSPSNPISPQLLKVAGVSNTQPFDVTTDAKENNTKNKGISINLAWVLVLIPAGLAYVIIKRKLNPLKFLSRKTV